MICYFGRDAQGCFYDAEGGRTYLPEADWLSLVQAGAHAGADTKAAEDGKGVVRLSITERITLEKFEAGKLVDVIQL